MTNTSNMLIFGLLFTLRVCPPALALGVPGTTPAVRRSVRSGCALPAAPTLHAHPPGSLTAARPSARRSQRQLRVTCAELDGTTLLAHWCVSMWIQHASRAKCVGELHTGSRTGEGAEGRGGAVMRWTHIAHAGGSYVAGEVLGQILELGGQKRLHTKRHACLHCHQSAPSICQSANPLHVVGHHPVL